MATRTQSRVEKTQAGDGDGFQRDGDHVGLVQRQLDVQWIADVGDELDAVDDDGGQQEGEDRERADADQQDVDGAGDVLAAAAVAALGEMLIVVGAHGGREAGDVVAPAGEDVSDDGIDAGWMRRVTMRVCLEKAKTCFAHGLYDFILPAFDSCEGRKRFIEM